MYFQNMDGSYQLKTKLLLVFLKRLSILSEGRKPDKLRTDKGTEFLNESFHQYLKRKNIHFYTANDEQNASVVERVNQMKNEK